MGPNTNTSARGFWTKKNFMDTFTAEVIAGYRKGLKADVVQFAHAREWGIVYTLPPASPAIMEALAGRFVQLRAQRLRLARRARLRRLETTFEDVVIITELPARSQRVWNIITGRFVRVRYLSDEPLQMLERALGLAGAE